MEHSRGIYGIDDLDFKYEDDDKMIVVGTIGDYDDSQIGAMLLNLLIEDDVTYNINFQENVDVGGFTNVGNGIRVGLAMEVDSPTGTKMVSAPYYEVQARIIHECTHAYTYNKGYRAQVYNRVNSTYNDKFVIANHYQEATAIIVEERFRQEKGYPARDIEKYNGIGTDVNAYGMWPWDAAKVYGVSMSGYTQPLTLMETVFIWYDIQRNYERSKIK